MKSLKVKINLNHNQELILNTLSNEHRLVYNHLLENVIKSDLDYKTINDLQRIYRHNNSLTINAKSTQNTSIGLINNIKSFLALKKKDPTSKFPHRFKSHKYFTTFMLDYNSGNGGFKLFNNSIVINLLSKADKAPKLIIDLPQYANTINNDNIKTVTFKKENDDYYLIFVYSEPSQSKLHDNNNIMSIDLGLTDIVTCFTNATNSFSIKNKKCKYLELLLKDVQSKLDLKVKNSNKNKKLKKTFNRINNKIKNKNKDFQHKVSKKIIEYCLDNNINTLLVGDIKTKKLIKDTKRKIDNELYLKKIKRIKQEKGMNKSTQGRGTLSRLKTQLEYKANSVGLEFHLIDEYNTSKVNCLTQKIEFDSSLDNRQYKLKEGLYIDRDINSAVNFIIKYKATWLSQVQELLETMVFDKMYLDENSNMIKIERNFDNLF